MSAPPFVAAVCMLSQVQPHATAGATDAVSLQSIWDFVLKGGPMMIPIIACSFAAVTVFVERMFSLRQRNVIPRDLPAGIRTKLEDGESNHAALEACRTDRSALANILSAAIKHLGEPVERLEKHVVETGRREILNLRKYLRVLAVVAAIAPLMGLLGTIFGMIDAFQTVALSGDALGKTELLAKGIYQALITTAAGLIVAIPALLAHHYLSARIERLVCEMDILTVEFIEDLASPRRAATLIESAHASNAAEFDEPQVGVLAAT